MWKGHTAGVFRKDLEELIGELRALLGEDCLIGVLKGARHKETGRETESHRQRVLLSLVPCSLARQVAAGSTLASLSVMVARTV